MSLTNLKLDLPKRWREMSRSGSENQILIRLCHISPLTNVDPKIFKDHNISETPNEIVTRRSVTPPMGKQPMGDFYKGMKAFASSGFAPPGTNLKVEEMQKQMTELHGPSESDFDADIVIAEYQNEEIARQSLKNYGQFSTKGFDVPIPGTPQISGMPQNTTIAQYLESDFLAQHIPKEQLEKMRSAMKDLQKQMPEVRQSQLKSGVIYQEENYLGCDAITTKAKGSEQCQALKVKNFIITGLLLTVAKTMSPGNTSCDSLTKLNPTPDIFREGNLITKVYHPAKSIYAEEGYLHKEEIDEIFKKIIAGLS
ncbi:MAG: hypothetical protein WC974_02290 [Thermoplasmata archaeon]